MNSMANIDCLIVGGGPAGLTTAIYLARYRRRVALVDEGNSRAASIPRTRNYPGFADGISGRALLDALREQAAGYAVELTAGRIDRLSRNGEGFTGRAADASFHAATVVLATGLEDKAPPVKGMEAAVARGLVRYCPICDGFEARDKRVAVLGNATESSGKALFLRTYSRQVTLLCGGGQPPDDVSSRALAAAGVPVMAVPIEAIEAGSRTVDIVFSDGARKTFDIIYPMFGSKVRSELAIALGAAHNPAGGLDVDAHQRTSVSGLYAIGDVVCDLHQIVVGMGHAAVAATDIHNRLPRNFC